MRASRKLEIDNDVPGIIIIFLVISRERVKSNPETTYFALFSFLGFRLIVEGDRRRWWVQLHHHQGPDSSSSLSQACAYSPPMSRPPPCGVSLPPPPLSGSFRSPILFNLSPLSLIFSFLIWICKYYLPYP